MPIQEGKDRRYRWRGRAEATPLVSRSEANDSPGGDDEEDQVGVVSKDQLVSDGGGGKSSMLSDNDDR